MRILFLLIFLLLAVSLAVPVSMRVYAYVRTYTDIAQVPKTDAALVLGASIINGEPSPILAARADAAIALYQAGKVERILVSGDGVADGFDEVAPVKKYLAKAGVPEDAVLLDINGLDTYSSVYRALTEYGLDSMTIVTQDFHLPRALFIARTLGMNAYGFAAAGRAVTANDYVREIPASIKAFMDLLSYRVAQTFEAEPVPTATSTK